jgi:hypothetical protein
MSEMQRRAKKIAAQYMIDRAAAKKAGRRTR